MHSGPFVIMRMWMLHAKPWQQLLICAVWVVAGVALVLFTGHPAGVLPAVFGVLFAVRIVRARFSRAGEP
jgi:hypothetical protein